MRYLSTRSGDEAGACEVLLGGLAADGGLYLPARWPRLSADTCRRLAEGPTTHADVMRMVVPPFLGGALGPEVFSRVVEEGLSRFRHPAVSPLCEMGVGVFLLELFHGPTFSFKDYGLQPLGALAAALRSAPVDEVGARRSSAPGPLLILGATSGDTGSAALAAFAGRPGVAIAILHPKGRISEVQRRQMTTIRAPNVRNIAIEGSFDDCQRLLKALLARFAARQRAVMSVNSINWGRILFQSVYYVRTAFRLAGSRDGGFEAVRFVVPSGNFGNAFAAIVARLMGAPIAGLLLATNRNDALAQVFSCGRTRVGKVHRTLSPAMDIQIPSNLERLVRLVGGEDEDDTARRMARLASQGILELPPGWAGRVPLSVQATSVGDDETLAAIRNAHARTDRILDPHTAVGMAALTKAGASRDGIADVLVATAHPAKFPDAVREALGFAPPMPPALADSLAGEESCDLMPPDETAIADGIEEWLRALFPGAGR